MNSRPEIPNPGTNQDRQEKQLICLLREKLFVLEKTLKNEIKHHLDKFPGTLSTGGYHSQGPSPEMRCNLRTGLGQMAAQSP